MIFRFRKLVIYLLLCFLSINCFSKIKYNFSLKDNKLVLEDIRYHIGTAIRSFETNQDTVYFHFREAEKLCNEINFSKALSDTYIYHGQYCQSQGQIDSTIYYYKLSVKTYYENGYISEAESMEAFTAKLLQSQGKVNEAMELYLKIVDNSLSRRDTLLSARFQVSLANLYVGMGLYTQALENYLHVMKVFEIYGFTHGLAKVHMNTGNIYLDQKEYDTALKYYRESLKIRESEGTYKSMGGCYSNIGETFFKQEMYDSAYFYYKKAEEIYNGNNSQNGTALINMSYGELYRVKGAFDKAFSHFHISDSIYRITKDKEDLSLLNNALAKVYRDKGEYNMALIHVDSALMYAIDVDARTRQKEALENQFKIYKSAGDFEKALNTHIAYKEIYDSIYSEDNNKKIVQLEVGFEFDKEREMMELERRSETELHNVQMQKQRSLLILSILGLFTLSIVAVFIFKNYRRTQKMNDEISNKNVQLKDLTDFKEGMTNMIIHDLKNPLNYIITATNSSIDKQNSSLNQVGKQMQNLVHNILDIQKMEEKKYVFNKTNSSISGLIDKAVEMVLYLADEKELKINIRNESDFSINADIDLMERVFINLLTNAIKHTGNNTEINIKTEKRNENFVRFTIEDKGSGIPENLHNKIFEKFYNKELNKNGVLKSTGLGLTFCKLVIENHQGTIGIEKSDNNGTIFYFEIPFVKINTDQVSTKEITSLVLLNKNEIKKLRPVLDRLSKIDFYESSLIITELNKIKHLDSENIENWAKKVEDSVFNSNEENYQKLIKQN